MSIAVVPRPVAAPIVEGADTEPPVRGERWLRPLDRWLAAGDRAVGTVLPADLNPFLQLGALANWSFLLAVVTGVALLLFYTPSVHQAHASMLAMDEAPWTSGLVRSLHRYTSDACLAMVLLHALKIFAARRFSGPRWWAWLTGAFALVTLWLIGWLGYWLPWDQAAQHVAEGSARALDAIPLFVDQLERSFVADSEVNSLLFFLVFFAHMLLPLIVGVGLWLHITRLARARFLPGRRLMVWSSVAFVAVSLAVPAVTGAPAAMGVKATSFSIDAWYLAPLWLTDRMNGGWLWLFWLVAGATLCSVPWLLVRGRVRPATVDVANCHSCNKCSADCPYLAITMVPRTDGRRYVQQAQVDPSACVGCGICAGSCDTAGVGLAWRPGDGVREEVVAQVERAVAVGNAPRVVFVCAHAEPVAAAADALIVPVSCIGFVHMLTVEFALKAGAREVVLASCGDGNCRYREGDLWTRARLSGDRGPFLRRDRVEAARVRAVSLPPGADVAAVLAGAAPRQLVGRRLVGLLVLAIAVVLTIAGSFAPYRTAHDDRPELVVSFKHPGQLTEQRRALTEQEKAALPVHMRRDFDLVRARQPVRLRITVDGRQALARTCAPSGIWSDGNAIAMERLFVPAGPHRVEVAIGDGADPTVYEHVHASDVTFAAGRRHALLFDRQTGFRWH